MARHSDLPLKGDAASRFLPWLVALMVFLISVAVASALVLDQVAGSWDHDVAGTVTVQVAPVGGDGGDALTEARLKAAAEAVAKEYGVKAVRPLDKKQTLALLEPWLGSSDVIKDLPLPRLIDVTIDPDLSLDLAAMNERIAAIVPGTSVDDHRVWLSRLIKLSRTVEALAVFTVLLIGAVTSATIVYATRTSMAVHKETIEVLHLIGAHDDYIARQFADRAFGLGLLGGFLGMAFTVPTLSAIGWAARRLEGGFLPHIGLSIVGFIILAILPGLAALLVMMTARLTVHRTLARLP
jgi:cell division transport system permease protein